MSHGTFATAFNCIDGRTQQPLINFVKKEIGVDHVDVITAPGMNKAFATKAAALESWKQAAEISVQKHGSQTIIVAGHYDCAGNPVDNAQHALDIKASCDIIKDWNWPVRVIGAWVNDKWEIETVYDSQNS